MVLDFKAHRSSFKIAHRSSFKIELDAFDEKERAATSKTVEEEV
jgi:hypothetical protein